MKEPPDVPQWLRPVALAIVLLLAACQPAPTSLAGPHISSSGFECPEPSPRLDITSTEINLYTWTEYVPVDIVECFGLVYGIAVNVDYFSSNEELNAKLAQGRGANAYDVVHPSDYMIDVLIREGLLQKLDAGRLPNITNLDPGLVQVYGAGTEYVVPYQLGTQAIVYNSATVSNPPTSWADLWNPDYAGRIVSVDDSRVVIGATLLTLGYSVNSTDPDELTQAQEKLVTLMPNIRVFDSDSPRSPLLAGDTDIGIVWNGEAALANQENADFVYVFPTEGVITFYDGMAISVDAPHPDAAYAWFNYLLQGDVFWLTMVEYPYTNPNQASLEYAKTNLPEIYEAYINSPITNTPADIFAAGHDIKDLGEALLLYDQIWTEIKGQ